MGTSSHTDSVSLYLTEKLSPTRRRGGGAAAGAPTADLAPTAADLAPTAADLAPTPTF
jgi:hypothetical protein